jgi:hypothetical protein
MDRRAWLAERRAAVVASYDRAAAVGGGLGYLAGAQRDWIVRMLAPDGRGRAGQPAMATATGRVPTVIRAVTFWVPVLTSMTWPA